MSDMQYKDHLRGMVNHLKDIEKAGVSEEAKAIID